MQLLRSKREPKPGRGGVPARETEEQRIQGSQPSPATQASTETTGDTVKKIHKVIETQSTVL